MVELYADVQSLDKKTWRGSCPVASVIFLSHVLGEALGPMPPWSKMASRHSWLRPKRAASERGFSSSGKSLGILRRNHTLSGKPLSLPLPKACRASVVDKLQNESARQVEDGMVSTACIVCRRGRACDASSMTLLSAASSALRVFIAQRDEETGDDRKRRWRGWEDVKCADLLGGGCRGAMYMGKDIGKDIGK